MSICAHETVDAILDLHLKIFCFPLKLIGIPLGCLGGHIWDLRFGMQDLNPMFEEWDAPSSSVVTSKRKKATPDTGVRENTNSLNQRLGTTTRSAISNIQPVSVEKVCSVRSELASCPLHSR